MARDLYSDVTARILQSMEAGVIPWEKAWKAGGSRLPMNAITDRPYSGVNVLLFWLSADCGYARPRYLTFKQAKEAGGNVRKGEHGTKVYFFKQLTVADKASGEDKTIPLLREYTVFNVSQCDGLPDRIANGEYVAPFNQDQRESLADRFITSTGADFREGTGAPCYVPSKDFISMPAFEQFKARDDFYTTSFHELTHWTGAKHRLNRDFSGRFGTQAYAAEELVAELGAAFINAELALSGSNGTRPIWRVGWNCSRAIAARFSLRRARQARPQNICAASPLPNPSRSQRENCGRESWRPPGLSPIHAP